MQSRASPCAWALIVPWGGGESTVHVAVGASERERERGREKEREREREREGGRERQRERKGVHSWYHTDCRGLNGGVQAGGVWVVLVGGHDRHLVSW